MKCTEIWHMQADDDIIIVGMMSQMPSIQRGPANTNDKISKR
jgi:hypothetical protein